MAVASVCSALMRLMSRRMRSWLIRILSDLLLRPVAGLAVKVLCGRAILVPFPFVARHMPTPTAGEGCAHLLCARSVLLGR
jgi:hypothetical protein